MTPAQIWALPYGEWLIFAFGADAWVAKQRELGAKTSRR